MANEFLNLPVPSNAANTNDGDGNKITSTVTGPKRGLDVQLVGGDVTIDNAELAVELSAADGDNVYLANSGGTEIGTAGSPLRVDPTGTTTQPVSATALPLPTGAATAAAQATGNASLSSIDAKLTAPLTVTGPLTDAQLRASAVPVSNASLPLPTGASTEATLALIKAKTDNLDVALSTRAITGLTDAQLRASAVPVSAASLPLPSGAATAALQTQPGVDIGDVTINNAAGAAAVNIQDGGNSITVDGPLTDAQLRASAVPVTTVASAIATYAAATSNQASAGSPTDFFTITGSGTKTVKVSSIQFRGMNTAANGAFFLTAIKRSTANSGGTSATITAVPLDSANAAATAVVRAYTVNPTLGTTVGNLVAAVVDLDDATVTPAGIQMFVIDFSSMLGQPLVLRGTGEVLALSFGGTAISSLTHGTTIIWTEE